MVAGDGDERLRFAIDAVLDGVLARKTCETVPASDSSSAYVSAATATASRTRMRQI
jgi:hypothetical protein